MLRPSGCGVGASMTLTFEATLRVLREAVVRTLDAGRRALSWRHAVDPNDLDQPRDPQHWWG